LESLSSDISLSRLEIDHRSRFWSIRWMLNESRNAFQPPHPASALALADFLL
jgi:hypothetical protein